MKHRVGQKVALRYMATCDCDSPDRMGEEQPKKNPAERSKDLGQWEPSVDHGYNQPLSGGFDIMKRLQDSLLKEQGRSPRPKNPRLASSSEPERWMSLLLALLRAQHWNYWASHWQVWGDAYYGDHLLFERLYGAEIQGQIDSLAEKMVAYFGPGSVDSRDQMGKAHQWISRWSGVSCPHRRALLTEDDFQALVKNAYKAIKRAGSMTLGLDDFLMAMANQHETNTYLLQQRLSIKKGERVS